MKAKKKKSLKSGKLTMKQLIQYRKVSKGAKKIYWSGRIKGLEKRARQETINILQNTGLLKKGGRVKLT